MTIFRFLPHCIVHIICLCSHIQTWINTQVFHVLTLSSQFTTALLSFDCYKCYNGRLGNWPLMLPLEKWPDTGGAELRHKGGCQLVWAESGVTLYTIHYRLVTPHRQHRAVTRDQPPRVRRRCVRVTKTYFGGMLFQERSLVFQFASLDSNILYKLELMYIHIYLLIMINVHPQ